MWWHIISVFIVSLVVVSFTHWVYRWRNPKFNGKLPPGSMGWPLLGETFPFFATNRTWDIAPFIKERMTRYGSVFKTSIVGLKLIVSTDSDLNYMIFLQEGQLVESWYPDSLTKIFGVQNLGKLQGYLHKFIKNMVRNLIGYESLKNMLSDVESVAKTNFDKWAGQEIVELNAAIADLLFGFYSKRLISYDEENSSENLRENFEAFLQGLISIPVPIPGTAFYKCLQRKGGGSLIRSTLIFLTMFLRKDNTLLTEDIALNLMFGLLFVSFESTVKTLLVALKHLTDNPQALKELTEEHEKIIKKRGEWTYMGGL